MPTDSKVEITFNYNGGNPTWTVVPESLPIPHGDGKRIQWLLKGTGAAFPRTGGITFKEGADPWPGTAPSYMTDTKYFSEENNTNPGPGKVRYPYTIAVVCNGQTYQYDPDVSNDPPPGDEDGDGDGGGSDQHGHQGGGLADGPENKSVD